MADSKHLIGPPQTGGAGTSPPASDAEDQFYADLARMDEAAAQMLVDKVDSYEKTEVLHAPNRDAVPEPVGFDAKTILMTGIGGAPTPPAPAGWTAVQTRDAGTAVQAVKAVQAGKTEGTGTAVQAGKTGDTGTAVQAGKTGDTGTAVQAGKAGDTGDGVRIPPEAQEKIANMTRIAGLWKYHPIPPEPAQDRSRESWSAELTCGAAAVLGASARGRKHIHNGTDCDDWFVLDQWEEERVLFIAVSDGAGSRKFSRVGARVSCQTAVESLKRNLRWLLDHTPQYREALHAPEGQEGYSKPFRSQLADLMTEAMETARDRLYQAYMDRVGLPGYESLREYRDLSGTLLLAMLIPLDNGEYLVVTCQVGDGGLVMFNSRAPFDQAAVILGSPDSGEFAGETEFLTSTSMSQSQNLRRRVQLRQARLDTMLVMTDGVADDYFPSEPEFFRLYFDLAANGILPVPARPGPDGEASGASASGTVPDSGGVDKTNGASASVTVSDSGGVPNSVSGTVPDSGGVPNGVSGTVSDSGVPSGGGTAPDSGGADAPAYPLPDPLAFPAASGSGQEEPEAVQYTWLIQKCLGLDLADLWDRPSILADAFRQLPERDRTPGQRLEQWLKNYVENTSFDDRTLVVVRVEEGGGQDAVPG